MGTLTTGSPTISLADWVRRHQSAARANLYIARELPVYVLAKLGLLDWRKYGERAMVRSLSLVKGATPDLVDELAEWIVETELWPKRRKDVLERLSAHQQTGAQIYVASSVMEPTAIAFGNRFGAKAIGAPVVIENGTLRLRSDELSGKNKGPGVLAKLGIERVGAAYGDTWADIPILDRADKPVAAYPDKRLRATAIERGWEILERE